MDSHPVSLPERGRLTHLSKLNILIHPLFVTTPPKDLLDKPFYDSERRRVAQNMIDRMTPGTNEATLFSPYIVNSRRKESLKDEILIAKENPEYIQWTDVCKEMVNKCGNGRNVLIGSNFVKLGPEREQNPQLLHSDLKKKGFSIDSSTEIVFGGESLNKCVIEGIETLFKLPKIKELKVDTSCTLSSSYYNIPEEREDDIHHTTFITHFIQKGMNVVEIPPYIIIRKLISP
jgi:hypothetical protein